MCGNKVAYLIVARKQKGRQEVKIDLKSLNISQSLSKKTYWHEGYGVINFFLIGFESYRLALRWEFMPGIITQSEAHDSVGHRPY